MKLTTYLDLITEFLYQFLHANSMFLQNYDDQVTRPLLSGPEWTQCQWLRCPESDRSITIDYLDTEESPLRPLFDAATNNGFCPELLTRIKGQPVGTIKLLAPE